MRRLPIFWLLLFLGYQTVFAQLQVADKRYPDSLLQLTKNSSSDSIRARTFFKLGDYWAKKDTVKAKACLNDGLKSGNHFPFIKALYYYFRARLYTQINPEKSEQDFVEADKQLSAFHTTEALLIRAKVWSNYANLQQRKGNEELMISILLNKAIPLVKKAGDREYLGKYYGDLGLVFANQLQYDKAEKYYQTAITILEQTKLTDPSILFLLYLYISKAYLYNHNDKALLTKNILNKAKNILPQCSTLINQIEYQWVESMYYRTVKAYDKALECINTGMGLAKQLHKPYYEEKLNSEKVNILTASGNFKKATIVLDSLIKNPQSKHSINLLNYYEQISHIYDTLGNNKLAYMWLKKYSHLKDSLTKLDILGKINAMEIKFKTVENQKKIAELNTANQKANLSAKNSRLLNWLLGTTILFILSILFFGIYYYRNQKKQAAQTEAIRLSQAMITGQETERYRIARELHDGLGNILAVVKFNLGGLVIENQTEELQDVTQQLDLSINELRRIAHDMMPEMLMNIGIEAALKDLCESLSSQKLTVDYHFIKIKNTIPQQIQLAIYRIVQELLTNVVKHAQATNVFLQFTQHKGIFFISLEDDGKGFDPHLQGGKTGIGLNNIKSRVAYLNGKIDITPRINGSGTSINIELHVNA